MRPTQGIPRGSNTSTAADAAAAAAAVSARTTVTATSASVARRSRHVAASPRSSPWNRVGSPCCGSLSRCGTRGARRRRRRRTRWRDTNSTGPFLWHASTRRRCPIRFRRCRSGWFVATSRFLSTYEQVSSKNDAFGHGRWGHGGSVVYWSMLKG